MPPICYNPRMIRNNLSTILGTKRLRVADIVRMTDLDYKTVNRIYNDVSKGIEFSTLDKLCWALECTPNEIFEYIDPSKQN